mgnify:CR=1 FL=1
MNYEYLEYMNLLQAALGFTVPAEYLTERVSVKGYIDVMNSGDKVQVIVPSRADFVGSNVKFASVADTVGLSYEYATAALATVSIWQLRRCESSHCKLL